MNSYNFSKDNKRLKQQLAVAQDELRLIKSSQAFKSARLMGHVKSQFKQSPAKFAKKALARVIGGGVRSKSNALQKNLSSTDSLQSQYDNWIIFNEPDVTELDQQKVESDQFAQKPLISIITPVFNPPKDVFIDLIESVLAQTYPNFELCLGDFGDNQTIRDVITMYAKQDSRVRSLTFAENQGIAENSNKILSKARGEYIALLDHDDTLSKDALFENVKLINKADYDFIYSDKDKIDEQGKRFEPFFKPGWSPEIMLNANYLTHLNVMKTSIVKAVGGWDSTTDGAQDWDLFFKVINASKNIGHIQKVLYHWRVIATSTAMSIETKPYALAGQRIAVDKYLNKENIPAKSYHVGAELLLDWQASKKKLVCFVRSHSSTHLRQFINNLEANKELPSGINFIIFHNYQINEQLKAYRHNVNFVSCKEGRYADTLAKVLLGHNDDYALFYDDRLTFDLNEKGIRNLTGWLEIEGVKAVSPRIVTVNDFAIDCGAMITDKGIKPLFLGSPPYLQAALGNIEWVRNMTVISPFVFASSGKNIAAALKIVKKLNVEDSQLNSTLQLQLSSQGRLVFNPKAMIHTFPHSNVDIIDQLDGLNEVAKSLGVNDPYMNRNLSSEDPMQLTDVAHENTLDDIQEIEYGYQLEAGAHANTWTLSNEDIQKNSEAIHTGNAKKLKNINSILIFLPDFTGIYAGLNNIFSFADYLHNKGVKVKLGLITADKAFDRQRKLIEEKFPKMGSEVELFAVNNKTVTLLPHVDMAVCTQWATAYLLARFNKTYRKCYFIQDKEASFYPKGTISALVENTYKFGYFGLANTPGLLDWYKKEYGGHGVVVKSRVDLSKYSPAASIKTVARPPYKVFFYARPNEPRNAFELGVASLIKLKQSLGSKVEIFAAGAAWDPVLYGLDEVVTNLGKIDYDKLPAFYRSMDVGLMFMYSGHPGVVASELMASGCPVVVNEYNDSTWNELYQDGKTCVVSISTANEVARNLERCLLDSKLRKTIIEGGLQKAKSFYAGYEDSIEKAWSSLLQGRQG